MARPKRKREDAKPPPAVRADAAGQAAPTWTDQEKAECCKRVAEHWDDESPSVSGRRKTELRLTGRLVARRPARVLQGEILVADWRWCQAGAKPIMSRVMHYKNLQHTDDLPYGNFAMQTMVRVPYHPLCFDLSCMRGLFLSMIFLVWAEWGCARVPRGVDPDELRRAMHRKRVLVLGCGGGHIPMALMRTGLFARRSITVVDVEPAMFELAEARMFFNPGQFTCVTEDAAKTVRRAASGDAASKFDLIITDAFESVELPLSISQRYGKFVGDVSNALAPGGVAMTNAIGPDDCIARQRQLWAAKFSEGGSLSTIPVADSQVLFAALKNHIPGDLGRANIRATLEWLSETFKFRGDVDKLPPPSKSYLPPVKRQRAMSATAHRPGR